MSLHTRVFFKLQILDARAVVLLLESEMFRGVVPHFVPITLLVITIFGALASIQF